MYTLLISSVFILFYEFFFIVYVYVYSSHIHYDCPRRDVYGNVPRADDDGAERGGIKWYGEWSGTKPRLLLADLSTYHACERSGEYTTYTTHVIINMDVESRN